MKKVSDKLKNYIFDAVLLIALGLVMLIWPQYSLKIIFKWAGIGFIIIGVIKCLTFFLKKDKKGRSIPDLLIGLLQIAVGIYAVVKADVLASHFIIVAAVLLGYGAIVMIIRALKLKNSAPKVFPLCFVLGLVTLVLAVIVFVHPVVLKDLMTETAGISLIVEGISLLIVMSRKEQTA